MTGGELAYLINRLARLHLATGMTVAVRILDAKHIYGVTRVQVTPVAGSGKQWVDRGRVTLERPDGDE